MVRWPQLYGCRQCYAYGSPHAQCPTARHTTAHFFFWLIFSCVYRDIYSIISSVCMACWCNGYGCSCITLALCLIHSLLTYFVFEAKVSKDQGGTSSNADMLHPSHVMCTTSGSVSHILEQYFSTSNPVLCTCTLSVRAGIWDLSFWHCKEYLSEFECGSGWQS